LAVACLVVGGTVGCKKTSTPTTPTVVGGAKDASVVIPKSDGYGTTGFSPGNLVVAVGTQVVWENQDTQAHTVTSDTNIWNGGASPGDAYSRTFNTKGSFAYHCNIHPGMTGVINVQ
jgi:plastocyanin